MKGTATKIFLIIFIGVGASVAFIGMQELFKAGASTDWPYVQGQIISSEIERRRHNTGSKGSGSSITYHANILYKYSVNGTDYSGDRVTYGDYGTDNTTHATEVISIYPTNRQVNVYYMPQDPAQGLLEPGIRLSTFLRPGIGLVLATMGLIMFYFRFKRAPARAREEQFPKP